MIYENEKKFLLIAAVLLIVSCNENKSPDCFCTEEFRQITVLVVDFLDNPVDSLDVDIVDESGRMIVPLKKQVEYRSGLYCVIDYSNVHYLTITPTLIYYSATNSIGRLAYTFFLVKTDDCQCHVYKAAGVEKIVLK